MRKKCHGLSLKKLNHPHHLQLSYTLTLGQHTLVQKFSTKFILSLLRFLFFFYLVMSEILLYWQQLDFLFTCHSCPQKHLMVCEGSGKQTETTSLESCLSRNFMPWSFTLQHKSYSKHSTNFVFKWTSLFPEFITSYLVTSSPPLIYIILVIHKFFRRLLQNACVCCRHSCFPRTKTRATLSLQTPQHTEREVAG